MRVFTTFLLFGFTACLIAGCESSQTSRPRADSPEIVARARNRVLGQLPDLDVTSRDMIQTNAPTIRFSGVPFGGDYIFEWMITSNRTVAVDTFNTFEGLETSPVKVRQPVSTSHY